MHLRWFILAAAVAVPLAGGPATAAAQEVLLSAEQALHEVFPEVAATAVDHKPLGDDLRGQLAERLGRRIDGDTVIVTRVFDAEQHFRGYAVVTNEVGKYRPITFMVGVTPDFAVRDVAVMIYRESRGGEVKRERFLSQYRGKRASDPINSNRDIINISGATISVRSLNAGVKRVLAEIEALYAPGRMK